MTDTSHIELIDRNQPLLVAWPTPGNPGDFLQFEKAAHRRRLVGGLGIDPRIPDIVRAKFQRTRTLYLFGWLDFSVVKAGELAGLIALELEVVDRYGRIVSKRKRTFLTLLKYMVTSDGLTDEQIPLAARCGETAVGRLMGEIRPILAERRNALAHGEPFDSLPTGGLLELVRDLINFAYRHNIAEGANLGMLRTSEGRG